MPDTITKQHKTRNAAGLKWDIERGEKHQTQKGYLQSTFRSTYEADPWLRYELVVHYNRNGSPAYFQGEVYVKVGNGKFGRMLPDVTPPAFVGHTFSDIAEYMVMSMREDAKRRTKGVEETAVKLSPKPKGTVTVTLELNDGDSRGEAKHVKTLVEDALGERATVTKATYVPGRPTEEEI